MGVGFLGNFSFSLILFVLIIIIVYLFLPRWQTLGPPKLYDGVNRQFGFLPSETHRQLLRVFSFWQITSTRTATIP